MFVVLHTSFDDKGLNCFEHMMATASSPWGREYEYLFSYSWGFEFKEKSDAAILGESLYNGSFVNESMFEFVNNMIGIQVLSFPKDDASKYLQMIQEELDAGRPVGVEMNSFWCPFHPVFEKQEIPHNFLLIERTADESGFHCYDPFFYREKKVLMIEEIERAPGIIFYLFVPEASYMPPSWSKILQDVLDRLLGIAGPSHAFRDMRAFAKAILRKFDLRIETAAYPQISTSPLFLQISNITNNRFKFSRALSRLSEQCGRPLYHEQMYQAGVRWKHVETMMLKAIFTTRYLDYNSKIASYIETAADWEEDIASGLQKELSAYHEHFG